MFKTRRSKRRLSLQRETKKPQVKLEEQISQSATSSILPMQSSCTTRKTEIVLGCGRLDHLVRDCPKDLSRVARKVNFKCKRGDNEEGRLDPSETSSHLTSIPWTRLQEPKDILKCSLLEFQSIQLVD